ncbi:uncharacterized protein LOC131850114 [Achroia grisella]|uniref:uncharacterized protein LOC131850114 n=1 Tax=Achroia grisella TaxID=688607 RepID=UPI0027D31FFA|nr:uncharacterized protein LOC131850114 [Achroia grisella]
MDSYIKVQLDLNERINKAKSNFKKSPKERLRSLDYINTRLEALEELWQTFTSKHIQLIESTDTKVLNSSSYVSNSIYESTEELYIEYKFLLKECLSKLKQNSIENASCSGQNNDSKDIDCSFNLPKISILPFSGKYSEWFSFKDLFISLVHNNKRLDEVQKLHYLKGLLIGEAEQLLRHVPITHDNYKNCWEQLERRYNNKKYLSNCIMKRFMSQKIIGTESASALKELLDTTNECLHGLNNLGIDTSTWDVLVIYILCQKLDGESRKQWELKISEFSEELPTLKQFQAFIETRFRAFEFIDPKLSKSNVVHKSNIVHSNPKVYHTATLICPYCSENHRLSHCKKFSKDETDTRRNFVQSQGLCFNCLGLGHSVFACRQISRCRLCRRKHHSLLHPKNITNHNSTDTTGIANQSVEQDVVAHASTSSSSQDEATSVTACFSTSNCQVLLATALVSAQSKSGNGITLRCLIDPGSQASFITESAVQLLNIRKVPHKSIITGLGSDQGHSLTSKSMVSVTLQSLLDSNFTFKVQAFVLSKVTSFLPEKQIIVDLWSEFSNIELADPSFRKPNKIDILLGADVYSQILLDGVIKGPPGVPMAQRTSLGWIISGSVNIGSSMTKNPISMHISHVNEDELLKRFWELEADTCLDSNKHLTDEDKKCEEIFTNTTKRDDSGRYIVNLPFRSDDPSCKYGNSKDIAIKRFLYLEKRLLRDSDLKMKYADVISEYIELGHMEEIPIDQYNDPEAVYLPHQAVVRENRTTTKVRVVFDASCPGTNGISLNQDLLIGPTLQPELRHLLMRWRYYPICLVSDIVKMYRQIKVEKKHTNFQRLVWRDDPDSDLKHLKLLRVTFGTACAPYLAVRCLHQVAYDDGANYPLATERVLNHFYMDDMLTGCESVEEGKQIYKQMNELLQRGGFELQKWSSNSEELLKEISEENIALKGNIQLNVDSIMKILGLTWNRSSDEFEYVVQLPQLKIPVTKRNVISDISRIFDPLGWLAPVVIRAKIFIQKLWLSGINWDDELPTHLLNEWLLYRENLHKLTDIKFERWINTHSDDLLQELHGFCDASNEAYAAVVYLRVVNRQGEIKVMLIASKTKVAPLKQISIPRLELCGAVLLTRLLIEVAEIMKLNKTNTYAWTDSTIVLAWLNSRPTRWKTFVANRVSEIITSLEPSQWAHVSSKYNPADCASRGVMDLENQGLWKYGPSWLKDKIINFDRPVGETKLEEKKMKTHLTHICTNKNENRVENEMILRFSSLNRLLRVVALCRRFLYRCRKQNVLIEFISRTEKEISLKTCIKIIQETYLYDELKNLKEKGKINKKSVLTSLSPWIDSEGILRVGGRLQCTKISEDIKHPYIIPQKSHFTELLLRDTHEKTLHGGPQLMLNYLRSKFWIMGAKRLIKQYVHKCVRCVRFSSRIKNPFMGQLPSSRTAVNRAFYQSGVDYAGPINLRVSKGRGHRSYKGYICLFICMSTRAIHLEAVSDLSTEGFLAAFKRFVSRRGHCADVWSDNGTNFVGASRELKTLYGKEMSSMTSEIANALANNGTNWHFIPPHTPHFGGLWESGVRSTKHHLRRIIGNTTLTYEEMATVLTQIEACLNSRPISQITNNIEDPMPLTPGHFLVMEPLLLPADANYEKSSITMLKRWQFTQRLVQDFWRRWSREYLTQFHHRYKWIHKTPEPSIGDIVLVMESDLPPAKWLYGIVVQKHPGLDVCKHPDLREKKFVTAARRPREQRL